MRFCDRDLTVPNAFFDCCFTAVTRLKGATVAGGGGGGWLAGVHPPGTATATATAGFLLFWRYYSAAPPSSL